MSTSPIVTRRSRGALRTACDNEKRGGRHVERHADRTVPTGVEHVTKVRNGEGRPRTEVDFEGGVAPRSSIWVPDRVYHQRSRRLAAPARIRLHTASAILGESPDIS